MSDSKITQHANGIVTVTTGQLSTTFSTTMAAAAQIALLQQEVERLRDAVGCLTDRMSVKCQQPEAATCARLWEADHARQQLEAVDPELADEFPWGCDTVEHLATALLAAREGVTE